MSIQILGLLLFAGGVLLGHIVTLAAMQAYWRRRDNEEVRKFRSSLEEHIDAARRIHFNRKQGE